jgi:anti-sigma factor RsiW
MTCTEVGKLLQRYLDGHLDPPRGERLSAHLEDCRRCGLEADTYERIKLSLGGDAFPVPADSLARLREFGDRLARGDEPIGL